jgi:ElaB/YqjD/DUF883 family membrane-anchored ribosome-binding protein
MPGENAKAQAAKLREQIERTREQIAVSAHALREEVAMRADWREWVRRKPALMLMGAFAVGFFIGRNGD